MAQTSDGAGRPRRVAIACQGGGSHTAFTAGALGRLLCAEDTEFVGISGTSGGAVCAVLGWAALRDGDPGRARDVLDGYWTDAAATTSFDRLLNVGVLWWSALQHVMVLPAFGTYGTPVAAAARRRFAQMLQARVDFEAIDVDHDGDHPMLLLGAVDVRSGDFMAFCSRRDRITAEMVLASAAIPPLFRAVEIDGRSYWDGLFAQNPPVRELLGTAPDEIWVLQINPREHEDVPTSAVEIADRRNELAANLSLHQELQFIERLNEFYDDGFLSPECGYRPTTVRVVELIRSPQSRALGASSKLNRDPAFIAELMAHGRDRADEFMALLRFEDAWRRRDADAIMACFAEDATVRSTPPFDRLRVARGVDQIRPMVQDHLARAVDIDVTRRQVAREAAATWTMRSRGDAGDVRGRAEARLRGGNVESLDLVAGDDTSGR